MIRIAIVDDVPREAEKISKLLNKYSEEWKVNFEIETYLNAVLFLEKYKANYDIIFMDVKMPYMDGISAAHKLRQLDEKVLLFFVSSFAQYALNGYSVSAFDFIVKPVYYYDFSLKLTRALSNIKTDEENEILIKTSASGIIRISPSQILYIESNGHRLIYHTLRGDFTGYDSLKNAEKQFSPYGFARCNSCYLVNLTHVKQVKGYTCYLENAELAISQPRKKPFLNKLLNFSVGENE